MPSAIHSAICSPAAAAEGPVDLPDAPGWQLYRYRKPGDFGSWPAATRGEDFWISRPTLRFLSCHPQGMTTEALLLRHRTDGREVLLTAQSFTFQLSRQISSGVGGQVSRWNFRRRLLGLFRVRVLCIGQLLTSGDYAVDAGEENAATTLALALAAAKSIAERDCGYRAILLKDIVSQPADDLLHRLAGHAFTRLPTDPVMVADLAGLSTFDDYLDRLTSKYRVRYRKARSKLAGLRRRRLSPVEARAQLERLFALYRETSGGADVNVVGLKPDYLVWLADVGDLHAYFGTDGHLAGFTTAFGNGAVYQAHYLGLEDGYKDSHALYHNMLFDLLRDAVEGGYDRVDYGRTALEIKSSIGAEPEDFGSWLHLRPGWLNRIVPAVLPAVFTPRDWTPRNPYKQPGW